MKAKKRYAISDIHGNGRAFLKLLDHVDPDPEELVIVGDLGDRGLETWEVYKECDQLLDEGADIVQGNHDKWLLDVLNGILNVHVFSNEEIGGITTLKSLELARLKHGEQRVNHLVRSVLARMKPYYEDDNFIFVHAGLDPRIPYMDHQKPEALMMGCNEWRDPKLQHPFDQYVVFGHTPTWHVLSAITEEDARIWTSHRAKKIAIDTGAGFGRRLTMVDLQDGIAYAYDFEKRDILEYKFRKRVSLL
jgi:serine/threonine protein phosphatase 1